MDILGWTKQASKLFLITALRSPAGTKKRPQARGAFLFHDPTRKFHPVIQSLGFECMRCAVDGAAPGIIGAEHESADAGMNHCPRTHWTWLESRVKNDIHQAPIVDIFGRSS